MKRLLAALGAACLLAAGPAEKLELRYRVPVGQAWTTRGTLTQVATVTEQGRSTTRESSTPVEWREKVLEVDATRGLVKSMESPEGPLLMVVSPLGEQRLTRIGEREVKEPNPILEQPAYLPPGPVAPGDSWEIRQERPVMLQAERARFPAQYRVSGKGTFVEMAGGLAVLALDLETELSSTRGGVTMRSVGAVDWRMGLEPATGWVAWQELTSTTDQSTAGPSGPVGPSLRTVTTMKLQSQP